jgi:hypothetical protein
MINKNLIIKINKSTEVQHLGNSSNVELNLTEVKVVITSVKLYNKCIIEFGTLYAS